MAQGPDARCPSTVEQLVVGGANDVCGAPWAGGAAGHPVAAALCAALGVACAVTLGRRARASRAGVAVLVAAAALAGARGARAVLLDRADAPLHARATAAAIRGLVDDLAAFAAARHGCVDEIHNDCVACQPILRFVLPERPPCAPREGHIALRAGALTSALAKPSAACVQRGDAIECP